MLLSLLMLVVVVGGALAAPQVLEDSVIDDVFDEFDFLDVVEEGGCENLGCDPGQCHYDESDICYDKCADDEEFYEPWKSCKSKCELDETYNAQTEECNKKECPEGEEFDTVLNRCAPPLPVTRSCQPVGTLINEIEEATSDDFGLRSATTNDNCPERTCADYFDFGYRCVVNYICRGDTINTKGSDLLDVRSGDDDECCIEPHGTIDLGDLKCPKRGEVCCKHPDYSRKACGINSGCSGGDSEVERSKEADYSRCGRIVGNNTNIKVTLNGEEVAKDIAQPGEFPHMCLLFAKEGKKNAYIGGASLIARNKVLTVAHKFLVTKGGKETNLLNRKNIYVRCGEHDVKLKDAFTEYQESRVSKVHVHPDYSPTRLMNNIAILETEKNFIYQKHVGPVCLPEPGKTFEGSEECWSTGWGANSANETVAEYSDLLKKVKLHVEDREDCSNTWNNLPRFKSKRFTLRDSWMCIGGRKKSGEQSGEDTCQGDGGSPHVCKVKDQWVQVGAVAFSIGCGDGIPAIYSSVSDGMCWIDYIMTCVSLSRVNVNESDYTDALDTRTINMKRISVNQVRETDCRRWLDRHPALKSKCDIEYL